LDVLVNLGLLSLLVWEYVCWMTDTLPADVFGLRQHGIIVENVVQAAFAGECLLSLQCDCRQFLKLSGMNSIH
jgi:hypothetical protein